MSVSSLIQQFSSSSINGDSSEGSSPKTRRHNTVSGATSASYNSSGSGTRSPLRSRANTSSKLESITEDRIRQFNAHAHSSSESTDGNVTSSSRKLINRQISEGSNKPPSRKEPAFRQLSADSCGGRKGGGSPGPFRLPGMASASSAFAEEVQETDLEECISSLASNDPLLEELNINNHTKADSAVLLEIVQALAGNTFLKKLSMSNVKFSEDHAKTLADVLRTNTSLRVLNLESNRITRKGIAAIMKGLADNKGTAVTELRLANQYFAGGAGAEADIAKHLEKITSIIRLGYNFTSPSVRTRIDRYIMRNTDLVRQKRASLNM